jgi:type VI secretion system protein ImpG
MLRLHHPRASTSKDRHIDGLVAISSEPQHAPVHGEHGLSFARGRGVEIELDEEVFAGKGVYLFASVLEHFLGMYASVNSFVQLVARTRQRVEPLKRWPPRSGLRRLI